MSPFENEPLDVVLGSVLEMATMIAGYREALIREGVNEELVDVLTIQFAGIVWTSLWNSAKEEDEDVT